MKAMLTVLCWQRAIRAFLKVRTSYDVLPLSFRLIIFDTTLLVKKSLNILLQNGERPARQAGTGRTDGGRHRVGTSLGLQVLDLCRPADHL